MNVLSHTGNLAYVGHFQGNAMKNYVDVCDEFSKKAITVTPKVSVIMAYNNEEKAITALQLKLSNQAYENACTNKEKAWTNIDKIKYYVDALEKTLSEYTLLVDAYDVVFFKNIDDEFIEKYKTMNKEIVFNATKNNYPNLTIEGEKLGEGEFKYLNAGIAFGKTEKLLELYKEALRQTQREDIINPWKSEQLFVRLSAINNENVGIDSECKLFQTFSKTQRVECGTNIIIL